MPGGDRTGPYGMGPRTGRGAGYCGGFPYPGSMNPFVPRRGMGRGMGRGRGFGRGARGFYDAAPPLPPTLLPEQEQDLLERQIKFHEEAIRALKQQLGETQKTDREV